ncbi:MAG: rhodanese-like domain-containing protein [Bacteroidales bacterium]|nr:rhodanese-like domain-containing protein [Bacteroidales bacterium]
MKDIKLYISVLIIILSVFVSCNNDSIYNKKEIVVEQSKNVNETELLFNFIEKSGNLIDSKNTPALVLADEVYENIDNYLIIDIRDNGSYEEAHIENSINIEPNEIAKYLSVQNDLSTHKKIVLVCYAGQTASYYATLLRFIGYGNVYALKWGISGWANSSTNEWKNNISSKYISLMEFAENKMPEKSDYPKISTGKTNGYLIINDRVQKLATEGFKKAKIDASTVIENSDNYYIISYLPKEVYSEGHIKGSVQYEPRKSLDRNTFLSTLPTNKPIAVYCYSGHQSSSVAAYLRILGYDAMTVVFGANSFMYQKMINDSGHAFNPQKDIANFPTIN